MDHEDVSGIHETGEKIEGGAVMKYKVGDRTLLGEIKCIEGWNKGREYGIVSDNCYRWLSESEIDAIIIKPKRNIDRFVEMVEDGKLDDGDIFKAVNNYLNCGTKYSIFKVSQKFLLAPYSSPSRYPKLTPEELRAVKWLVEGGFETIGKDNIPYCGVHVSVDGVTVTSAYVFPIADCLEDSLWITESPINLAELLAAQEEFVE